MKQSPAPGEYLLKWRGDFIEVTLALPSPRKGRALLRTDIGGAKERRAEIIAEAEQDISPQSIGWRDIPLKEVSEYGGNGFTNQGYNNIIVRKFNYKR